MADVEIRTAAAFRCTNCQKPFYYPLVGNINKECYKITCPCCSAAHAWHYSERHCSKCTANKIDCLELPDIKRYYGWDGREAIILNRLPNDRVLLWYKTLPKPARYFIAGVACWVVFVVGSMIVTATLKLLLGFARLLFR